MTILLALLRMGTGSGMYGGAWGAGHLWLLLWVVAAVVLGVLVLALLGGSAADPGTDRALDVLRERYARGELGDEEYAERRERLRG